MQETCLVAPSVLSADFLHLADELASISNADMIHYDVMDGHFVPNLSFGLDILRTVKSSVDLPVDVHLMVSNPDDVIDAYLDAGADYLGFHIEAAQDPHALIERIHQTGAKATITVNPPTDPDKIEPFIELVDMVLVMSVNPGFGGQSFIEGTYDKLRAIKRMCRDHAVDPLIEVDGGVSSQNAREICICGANVLVAGSSVFKTSDRASTIDSIRQEGTLGIQDGR